MRRKQGFDRKKTPRTAAASSRFNTAVARAFRASEAASVFPMLGRCSPPPTAPPTAPAPDWTIPSLKKWEQGAKNQANLGSIHNSPSNGLHAVHGKVSDLCNSQFQSLRHTANSAWFSLKERLTLPTPSTTELPAFLTPSKMLVNKPFGSSFAGSCAIEMNETSR